MSYDQIAAQVNEPNEQFEAFFADMQEKIPALRTRGAVEIQPNKFKLALKIAYLAGQYDGIAKLLSND